MGQVRPQLVVATAAGAVLTGVVVASFIIGVGNKRETVAFECSKDRDIQYIIKSGAEYIIINPSDQESRNSFLVSKEVSTIPRNWLFRNMPVSASSDKGFSLTTSDSKPYIKSITFDTGSSALRINYGVMGTKPWTSICRPSQGMERLRATANNIPVEYLLSKQSPIPVLNPRLGQKQFNLVLYNAIKDKKGATYAIYQLLSGLPERELTANESLAMKEARSALIKANSSEMDIWIYDGNGRYTWEYENEKPVASDLAIKWCEDQQYSSLQEYTAKGYKIISSGTETRSSDGWVREDFPDGRFSGYVNYQAECNGTRYSLRLEGSVDSENENSADYYD